MLFDCKGKSRLRSPAKINVGLKIVGRRADGYHLIESLFWPLDFADEILFSESAAPAVDMKWTQDVSCDHTPTPSLPESKDNLAMEAWQRANPSTSKRISIQKRIPMGAGLGGGSSNAGTVLRYLVGNSLLSCEAAQRIAPQLGADVPFFLNPKPALVTGIGEQIRE